MKKILAVILALLMLSVTGMCFAETAEPECVEIWDIVAMFKDDAQMEEGTYPFMSFFLYSDGSVHAEYGAQILEGTCEMSDDPYGYIITIGEQSALLAYDEESGCLYMEDESSGQTGVFMLRADELYAESIEEFEGTWLVNSVITKGSLVSLDSEIGQETLSGLNVTDYNVVIEGSAVSIFGLLEGEAELVEGGLIVTTPNGECFITLSEGDSLVVVIPGENQLINKMFAGKE